MDRDISNNTNLLFRNFAHYLNNLIDGTSNISNDNKKDIYSLINNRTNKIFKKIQIIILLYNSRRLIKKFY